MTVSVNNKFYRVRTILIVVPIFTLFLAYILFKFLLPSYFITENKLITDKGIIKTITPNKYLRNDTHNGKYYENCIDISLTNKHYLIRLSDRSRDKYWDLLNNPNYISKQIEVKFQDFLLSGDILNNPNQISIDNKIIIPYYSEKKVDGWVTIIIIALIIICLLFIYSIFKKYKLNLLPYDKEIGQESKWKLLVIWLTE